MSPRDAQVREIQETDCQIPDVLVKEVFLRPKPLLVCPEFRFMERQIALCPPKPEHPSGQSQPTPWGKKRAEKTQSFQT